MPKKSISSKAKKSVRKQSSMGEAGAYCLVFFGLGVLVVIGVVVGYLFLSKPYTPNILTSSKISSLVSNATVTIPDLNTSSTLQNGKGQFTIDNSDGTVDLSGPYFSVKTSQGFDLYAIITVNSGGSGEFVYVALFKNTDGNVEYRGAYPIEDRVKVTAINGPVVSDSGVYELTVDYLGRDENEPMSSAPTVPKTVTIPIKESTMTMTQ